MQKEQRPPEREPIWSVAAGWLPWYLLLLFLLFFSWTAFVAWNEAAYGDYPARGPLIKGIIQEASGGILWIVLFALAAVTSADTGGGFIVVTYRYLNNKFVEPLRRQLREEGIEQGRQEGREQLRQFQERTAEWYARQQAALAKGEPFDEPPPFINAPNGKEPAGE